MIGHREPRVVKAALEIRVGIGRLGKREREPELSLSSSYGHEIAPVDASSEMGYKAITPAMATKLFTDDYERCTSQIKITKDEAFFADARKKRDVECFNWKKCSHVEADCWALAGGKEGKGKSADNAGRAKPAKACSEFGRLR